MYIYFFIQNALHIALMFKYRINLDWYIIYQINWAFWYALKSPMYVFCLLKFIVWHLVFVLGLKVILMRFKYNAYYRDTHCTDSNRKNDDMRKWLYILEIILHWLMGYIQSTFEYEFKDIPVRKNYCKEKAHNVFEKLQLVMSKG